MDGEENDGWLVPHGYLSDDEGGDAEEEVNISPENKKPPPSVLSRHDPLLILIALCTPLSTFF